MCTRKMYVGEFILIFCTIWGCAVNLTIWLLYPCSRQPHYTYSTSVSSLRAGLDAFGKGKSLFFYDWKQRNVCRSLIWYYSNNTD